MAILQNGAVPMDGLTVVAPLHYDVVHVVVRRDRGIHSILDLEGKTVVLGPAGSGMRRSAEDVLDHYDLTDRVVDRSSAYFHDMLEDPSLDAAIVTTGVANTDLKQLLHSEDFELLPLDAEALALKYAFFECFDVPRGLYAEGPPVPQTDVRTVATIAYLVVREGAPDLLVTELLESLYSEEVRTEFPHLISHRDAADVLPVRLHPVSERFFDPFDSIGLLAAVMESLAATKELIFAFGAGMYLLWDRWRRLKERERQEEIKAQKEHLDTFLERTLKVEHAQMKTVDPKELRQFLDEVTRIKLQALQELTNEDLRADQMFSLFLMQCANLISKIQMKLITRDSSTSSGDLHTD